jgi:hypothetical protein
MRHSCFLRPEDGFAALMVYLAGLRRPGWRRHGLNGDKISPPHFQRPGPKLWNDVRTLGIGAGRLIRFWPT